MFRLSGAMRVGAANYQALTLQERVEKLEKAGNKSPSKTFHITNSNGHESGVVYAPGTILEILEPQLGSRIVVRREGQGSATYFTVWKGGFGINAELPTWNALHPELVMDILQEDFLDPIHASRVFSYMGGNFLRYNRGAQPIYEINPSTNMFLPSFEAFNVTDYPGRLNALKTPSDFLDRAESAIAAIPSAFSVSPAKIRMNYAVTLVGFGHAATKFGDPGTAKRAYQLAGVDDSGRTQRKLAQFSGKAV